jgi:predicted ATPase
MILEEIENGIHPSRLRLLTEMLRQLSSRTGPGPQVFASTHSPVVLAWLTEEDLKHTFLCTRNDDTGASSVRSLASVPRFREIIRDHPAGELFTEGWMETTV